MDSGLFFHLEIEEKEIYGNTRLIYGNTRLSSSKEL